MKITLEKAKKRVLEHKPVYLHWGADIILKVINFEFKKNNDYGVWFVNTEDSADEYLRTLASPNVFLATAYKYSTNKKLRKG